MTKARRAWLIIVGSAMTVVGYRCMCNGAEGVICGILGIEPEK